MTDSENRSKDVKIVKLKAKQEIIDSENYQSIKKMLINRIAKHIKHSEAGYGEVDHSDYSEEEQKDESILEVIEVYAGKKLFGTFISKRIANKFSFDYISAGSKSVQTINPE